MRHCFKLLAASTLLYMVAMLSNTAVAQSSISFVGATTYTTEGSIEGSFALDVPSGVQSGDLLVMNMYHGASPNPTITAPGGWTQQYQDWTSIGGKHTVYYKVAGSSEPDSYTWQLSRSKYVAAGMVAYRGVDTSDPFHAQSTAHVFDATSIPVEITTSVANTRLLVFVAGKAMSAGATPDADMIERYDVFTEVRVLELAGESLASGGTLTRSVSIDDADGAEEAFALAVALLPVSTPNQSPVVNAIADRTGFEGDGANLQVVASDFDEDDLTYAATGLPQGLSIGSASGLITGTIDVGAASLSPYMVTVSVDDDINPPVEEGFTWTVDTSDGSISFVGSTTYTTEGSTEQSFALDVPSGVQSGDLLVMNMYHGASPNPTITAPGGWTQRYQDWTSIGGKHTVYYKVAGASEPDSYTWQLSRSKYVAAGMVAYRGVDTSDPFHAQSTAHVFDATSIPVEITTSVANTRLLVFVAGKAMSAGATPDADMIERYDVFTEVRVLELAGEPLPSGGTVTRSISIDDAGGAEEAFALAVALLPESAPAQNQPPVLDAIADRTGFEGDGANLQVVASDFEEDELTYAATGLPQGLTIGSASGLITGTIDAGAASLSPYTVTVSVNDGFNPSVEEVFTWTVGISDGSISFVGSTTYASDDGVEGSFALDVPSGVQSGDLLVMNMYHGASPNPTITAPGGWTQQYQDWTSIGGKHTVYYKVAGSSEPNSYTWQLSRSKYVTAAMAAYRGVDASNPFHAQSTAHVFDATSIPVEITTTIGGARLLMFVAGKAMSAGATPDANMVERYDVFTEVRVLELADEPLTSGGTVTRVVSIDDTEGAEEAFVLAVALLPESAPNQPPVVDPIADRKSFEGDASSVQVIASDINEDDLEYAATGLPPGLSIGASSGLITGAIGADAAAQSPYVVTVSVSDGHNPAVERTFNWVVGASEGPISFVGSTSYSSGETIVQSFALDVPGGVVAGDLLIMSMFHGANPDPVITAPGGWSQLYQESSSNGGKHTVYFRVAGTSEPDSYTWQLNASKHPAAGMVAYRGVNTSNPFHEQSEVHIISEVDATVELTTTITETRLLMFTAVKGAGPNGGATPDATMIERYDRYAFTRTAQMSDEPLPGSGTVSRNVSFDESNNVQEAFILAVTLIPESAPPAILAAALATDEVPLPDEFSLKPSYPNPFNTRTTVVFDLPEDAEVAIEVFDMLGRRVLTLPPTRVSAGASRERAIDAGALASGNYVYVVTARLSEGVSRGTSQFTLIK